MFIGLKFLIVLLLSLVEINATELRCSGQTIIDNIDNGLIAKLVKLNHGILMMAMVPSEFAESTQTKQTYRQYSCEIKPNFWDDLDPYANDRNFKNPRNLKEAIIARFYTPKITEETPIKLSHYGFCEDEPIGFFGRPNGCTGVPDWDLETQQACNSHDVCFMMLSGSAKDYGQGLGRVSNSSFSEHYDKCEEQFRLDLIDACQKKHSHFYCKNLAVTSFYPEGMPSALGTSFVESFISSQITQFFFYKYVSNDLEKISGFEQVKSDLQEKMGRWCQNLEREHELILNRESRFMDITHPNYPKLFEALAACSYQQ